jgi:hypothetical protein
VASYRAADHSERIGNLEDFAFRDLALSHDRGFVGPVDPRCTPSHQLCGTQRRQDREPKRSKIRRALNHKQPPDGRTGETLNAAIILTASRPR